jgi:hypothetical protein
MTWMGFFKSKLQQRDLTNKQVYISIAISLFIGWILG